MSKRDPHLITTYSFQGRDYLVKMTIINDCLELEISDKQTGEQWECTYNTSYIENLTRRTGNYKHFEIFTTMLKSGLLKTSECITLDLLTYEDLESLRTRKYKKSTSHLLTGQNSNRRYLILTYSVEFDRINYPLPLEYCGLPDPVILQGTIKRLESELAKLNQKLSLKNKTVDKHQLKALHNRIEELVLENERLQEKVIHLTKACKRKPTAHAEIEVLQKAITKLEKNVISERNSHNRLVQKLNSDKIYLTREVENLRFSEKCLRNKLQEISKSNVKANKINSIKEQGLATNNKSCHTSPHKRAQSPNIKLNKEQVKSHRSRSNSPLIYLTKINERSLSRSKSVESNSSIASTHYSYPCSLNNLNLSLPDSAKSSRTSRSRGNKRRLQKNKNSRSRGTSPYEFQEAVNDVEQFETQVRNMYRNTKTHPY